MRGHQFDGIFGIGGCDKNLPGLMMGMVRCNVPSVFMHGGATLPGRWRGADKTVIDTYEAIGGVIAGTVSTADLEALSHACLPTAGSCPGQFTANTMGMVSEALGLAPLGSSMIPAVFAARAPLLRQAGMALMGAVEWQWPLPRDIVTREALENAAAIVAATGGSTNAVLHIPAIANEAGIAFDMDDVADRLRPHAAHRQSAARRQISRARRLRDRRRAGDPRRALARRVHPRRRLDLHRAKPRRRARLGESPRTGRS